MFTRKDLMQLVDSDTQGHPVLSLYLTTDLAQHLKEERRLALRKLLGALGEAASEDAERVQRFFDQEFDWQAQGVALFCSERAGFWQVFRLAVPVVDDATREEKPNVHSLAALLDEHPNTIVALVDRDHARFFTIQVGEIDEFTHELPATPGRHKQGGQSASRWQRQTDALARLNLKEAARLAGDLYRRMDGSQLILAGTEDVLAQYRALLSKALQAHVIGETALDIHAPASMVLARTRELVQRLKRSHEADLVEELYAAARRPRPAATLGLADTLDAMSQGNVQRLVAAAGYQAGGFACVQCGYLAVQSVPACPLCGAGMHPVDHMVDLMVRNAIRSGGHVELVHDPAAVTLRQWGAIGALLRHV